MSCALPARVKLLVGCIVHYGWGVDRLICQKSNKTDSNSPSQYIGRILTDQRYRVGHILLKKNRKTKIDCYI